MKHILSIFLLLIPSISNAYIEAVELDLGSEKTYKELRVHTELWQEPYGSCEGVVSSENITRHYTQSNARLHYNLDRNNASISAGDYRANVKFASSMLQNNGTQVAVDYELSQWPWLSLFFNPTRIKSDTLLLSIDGAKHTVEYPTPNNELVTLAIVANWIQHNAPKAPRDINTLAINNSDNDDDNHNQ